MIPVSPSRKCARHQKTRPFQRGYWPRRKNRSVSQSGRKNRWPGLAGKRTSSGRKSTTRNTRLRPVESNSAAMVMGMSPAVLRLRERDRGRLGGRRLRRPLLVGRQDTVANDDERRFGSAHVARQVLRRTLRVRRGRLARGGADGGEDRVRLRAAHETQPAGVGVNERPNQEEGADDGQRSQD